MDHSPSPQSRATHAAGIPGRVSPRADADFLTLFETARPQMWLIAAGVTGNRSEADDVLQDAAMIAMRKFATFEPGTNFNAWMAEVTRNTARNARRKHLRANRLTQSAARLFSPAQHTPTPLARRAKISSWRPSAHSKKSPAPVSSSAWWAASPTNPSRSSRRFPRAPR